jgi:hypothetical protein
MARGVWMTFLPGVLPLVVGTLVAGISMLRAPDAPRRLALRCVLLVPATIVGAILQPGLGAVPRACLARVVRWRPTPVPI